MSLAARTRSAFAASARRWCRPEDSREDGGVEHEGLDSGSSARDRLIPGGVLGRVHRKRPDRYDDTEHQHQLEREETSGQAPVVSGRPVGKGCPSVPV